MEPLRVRISLKGSMVEPPQAFHLDALLGALRVQLEEDAAGAIDPKTVHHDIPVERHTSPSGQWVFKASAFKLLKLTPTFMWMQTGRADLTQVAEDRASGLLNYRASRANLAGGPFKSTVSYLELVWAELTAFAIGDKKAIESLLGACHQIGARRATGFGNVANIHVEPVALKDCHWDWRALPEDFNQATSHDEPLVMASGNLNAPYWDRRTYVTVLLPSGL